MILGYLRQDFEECQLKVALPITMAKKTSNILIAGKSGSGKSLSSRWYLWDMLHSGESMVFISDYKGGEEYEAFEGSPSNASGQEAIEMINSFYDFFTEVRSHRVKLQHHYTLFIEEYFGVITYAETQSKKLKAEIMSKVGELLAVSRGLNMGVIICIQRADASNFSSGSRELFQCVISFGRCSAEQFRMLGFSSELSENPTASYKAGQALALIDGQEEIHELLVPLIKNPDELCQGIRISLDKQPDIHSLTQAVATGRSMGL